MIALRDSPYRFVVGAIIIGVGVTSGFTWVGVSPLLPAIMDEFGVDRATVALLSSGLMMGSLLMLLPGGVLAARIGLRRTFAVGGLLMGSGGLTFVATNFWFVLVTRLVFGVGSATTSAASVGLIMQWFRGRELPIVNGLFNVAMSVGTTLALLVTVPLAGTMGWRGPLSLYGLVVFGLALAWLMLGRERRDATATATEPAPGLALLWRAARHRVAILLALTIIGPEALWTAYSAWLPSYYYQVFGWTLEHASSVTALINLAGIPATLVGGVVASRMTSRGPIFIFPGTVVVFAALGSFLVNDPTLVSVSVAALGVCIWGVWPALLTIPMETPGITPQLVPMIFAGIFTIISLVGIIAPISVGYLTDLTGSYLPGLWFWALASSTLVIGGLRISGETKKT